MIKPKTIKSICVFIVISTFILSLSSSLTIWFNSLESIENFDDFLLFKKYFSLLLCFIISLYLTFIVSICLYPLYALCNIDENISELNKKVDCFINVKPQVHTKNVDVNNDDTNDEIIVDSQENLDI